VKKFTQVKDDVQLKIQEIFKALPFIFDDQDISFGDQDFDVINFDGVTMVRESQHDTTALSTIPKHPFLKQPVHTTRGNTDHYLYRLLFLLLAFLYVTNGADDGVKTKRYLRTKLLAATRKTLLLRVLPNQNKNWKRSN
jgi:hypothetical protein